MESLAAASLNTGKCPVSTCGVLLRYDATSPYTQCPQCQSLLATQKDGKLVPYAALTSVRYMQCDKCHSLLAFQPQFESILCPRCNHEMRTPPLPAVADTDAPSASTSTSLASVDAGDDSGTQHASAASGSGISEPRRKRRKVTAVAAAADRSSSSSGSSSEDSLDAASQTTKKKRRTTLKPKGKHGTKGPKRAANPYCFFVKKQLHALKKQYPTERFQTLGPRLGEMWNHLDAATKKEYEDMAANDKARYNRELESLSGGASGSLEKKA